MKKVSSKDIIVTGFAVFAMFLGAGNLIFPPHIGINAGSAYKQAFLGFALTGILMPLLGLIATGNTDGSVSKFAEVVSRRFSIIFNILVLLCIGPMVAIPRTAATTYEVGIVPLFGELEWGTIFGFEISRIVVSLVYFILNYFLAVRPSKVIDLIGKYFTPALLTLLIGLIVKGIVSPIGVPGNPQVDSAFALGFKEGYQTMDAMASMAFGGIAIAGIKKFTNDKREIKRATTISAIIAATGLLIVYGGFIYLGATGSIVFHDIARTEATVKLVEAIGSNIGKIALSISMVFACFTTSIGLITTISNFFTELFNGRIKYEKIMIVVIVMSFLLSIIGVNKIIVFASPVLNTFYPTTIVLIILNLLRNKIKNRNIYRGAALGATVVGFLYALSELLPKGNSFQSFLNLLPLGEMGFAWTYIAVITAIAWVVAGKIFAKKNIENKLK